SAVNSTPIGRRRSSDAAPLIAFPEEVRKQLLEKHEVKEESHYEDNDAERSRTLPEVMLTVALPRRQRIDETAELLVRTRLRHQTHDDRDDHARRPRRDRCPERLRQLTRIGVDHREIPTLDAGARPSREREAVM